MKKCVHIKLSVSVTHSLALFLPRVNKLDTSAMAKDAYSVVTMIVLINPSVERGDSINDSTQEERNSILICPVLS